MTTVRDIACCLPAKELSNADLQREHPDWSMNLVARRTGIESRRIAAPDETAFDLTARACEELFQGGGVRAEEIGAILYCTHDPDYPMPGNAHLLQAHLGLPDTVLAFDYRLACSGFVYGLAMADAFARAELASGLLLVTAETASKRMNAGDRATRALFGDGAAVTFLSREDGGGGRVAACELRSHGAGHRHGLIPAGGAREPVGEETKRESTDLSGNVRTPEDMYLDGARLWAFVNSTVSPHVQEFLDQRSLGVADIDLFVFHQASSLFLDSLGRALSIPSEKLFTHLRDVGNLSSASIPFALHAALDQGAIGPGDKVLACGFGAGYSYGTALLEY